MALIIGCGGLVMDYGLWWFRPTEPTHIPVAIYLTIIAIAWGVESELWLSHLKGFAGAKPPTNGDTK